MSAQERGAWPTLRAVRQRAAWLLEAAAVARKPRLRLLVMAVADRCDQRCLHCQIWQGAGERQGLTRKERLAIADDAIACGVEEVLLTGGEPLLSPDLWPLAERFRAAGVRLMLATNGMLLERYAAELGRLFDEVYVSLDGASPSSHDLLRGVAAFARLSDGVAALRRRAPGVRVVARSTLHAGNLDELEAIVESARSLGFHHCSFLPLDAASTAFGGDPGRRRSLIPSAQQVAAFEAAVDGMAARGWLADGFVLEDAPKLRRLARHLAASGGRAGFERPACDAPWWSSVVEADGALRPCFFHAAIGDARGGLGSLRSSAAYRSALSLVRSPNPICQRCVCPKKRGG